MAPLRQSAYKRCTNKEGDLFTRLQQLATKMAKIVVSTGQEVLFFSGGWISPFPRRICPLREEQLYHGSSGDTCSTTTFWHLELTHTRLHAYTKDTPTEATESWTSNTAATVTRDAYDVALATLEAHFASSTKCSGRTTLFRATGWWTCLFRHFVIFLLTASLEQLLRSSFETKS